MDIKLLIELYISFLKVGFTSFGGLSMIPVINSEMTSHGWMTAAELSDIVAIAEMTPGPLGFNCATFAGTRAAGVLGAVVANLGVMTPALTVCFLVAVFFEKFKNGKRLPQMMIGIRPVCIGLVFSVMVTLSMSNYAGSLGGISLAAVAIGIVDLVVLLKYKLSVAKIILLSAALGIIFVR